MYRSVVLAIACMFSSMCSSKASYVAQEERKLENVNVIYCDGPIDLVAIQDEKSGMVVDADDVLLEKVQTKVDDNALYVSFDGGNVRERLRVVVRTPVVSHIEMRGSGDLSSEGVIRFEDLNLVVVGSGDVKLDLEGKNLGVHSSGPGDIYLDGSVNKQTVVMQGPGDYHAQDLQSSVSEVSIYGPGDAYIQASRQLSAGVFGPGDLIYSGSPTLTQHVTGTGRIIHQ